MNKKTIKEIVMKAINKYVYLKEETALIDIYDGTIRIYWYSYNDKYINHYRIKQIANFLHKHLPECIIYDAFLQEFKFND